MNQETVGLFEEDFALAEACLSHQPEAWSQLRSQADSYLRGLLIQRGAYQEETEAIVADIWSDSLISSPDRKSLLSKYHGRCSLCAWLGTVATNRLIDQRRSASFRYREHADDVSILQERIIPGFEEKQQFEPNHTVKELIQSSLIAQIEKQPEALRLMIRLVFIEGLTQREIARMWGSHESKISRMFNKAFVEIREGTLETIKQSDPWLQIEWKDILELSSIVSAHIF